jgi:hypothetical protein
MAGVNAPTTTRFLSQTTAIMFVVLVFLAAIPFAPLAALVLLIANVSRRLNPDDEFSTAWLFVVMGAGMVINIIALPPCLFWSWITGKQAPPSPQLESYRRRRDEV